MFNQISRLVKYFLVLLVLTYTGCRANVYSKSDRVLNDRFTILESISNYLETKVAVTGFGGKVYCGYEVLDSQLETSPQQIYLWVVCQEYYEEEGKLTQGTGTSFPVALNITTDNEQLLYILDHIQPRDGSLYSQDIAVIFPAKVGNKIKSSKINDTVQELITDIQKQVNNDRLSI